MSTATIASTPAIEAQGLHVHAGEQVLLRDVSLTIAPAERVAIVGHNGAGKSTLLRTVSAFSQVHEGRLNVLGIDVTLLRE